MARSGAAAAYLLGDQLREDARPQAVAHALLDGMIVTTVSLVAAVSLVRTGVELESKGGMLERARSHAERTQHSCGAGGRVIGSSQ